MHCSWCAETSEHVRSLQMQIRPTKVSIGLRITSGS